MDEVKAVPKLTDRQLIALNTVMQRALFNPEIAADFIVNPRHDLRELNMSEEDIAQISIYIRYALKLAERDHLEDW